MTEITPGYKKPAKITNALVKGIIEFIEQGLPGRCEQGPIAQKDLPKRYTIYEPMLLLPQNFTRFSSPWHLFYKSLSQSERLALCRNIVICFNQTGHNVTHIAVNAPIEQTISDEADNVLRSPIDLQPLYGDFGPDRLITMSSSVPTSADFEAAFWVEASQVSGIKQIWAPQWTMFSRGNVREKARISGHTPLSPSPFPGLSEVELGCPVGKIDVVDMYVGIGYFALPYLLRGVRRVFGWDLNGWSVEGLRRGCEKNDIACKVVPVPIDSDTEELTRLAQKVAESIELDHLRCIVFWGDNQNAAEIMEAIQAAMQFQASAPFIRHCNLGLLPSSAQSWRHAVAVMDSDLGGFLHIHENAGTTEVEQKREFVLESLRTILREIDRNWLVECMYTEQVKTYAPGVGHYVFDIKLWPAR